jgi:hypothetical protein
LWGQAIKGAAPAATIEVEIHIIYTKITKIIEVTLQFQRLAPEATFSFGHQNRKGERFI